MARRAMNALQLALGSVGSGIQGYTQARTQREAQDLEAQRYAAEQERLQKAEARQMVMDLVNLQGQGYEPLKDVQRKQQAAIGAVGAVESMARSGLSGMFGAPVSPAPTTAGLEALGKGYATARPDRTIEYGGQQFALRETPAERQERLAKIQDMQRIRDAESAQAKKDERISKMIEAARKGGRNSQAAIFLAAEDKDAFNALFPEPKGTGLSELQRLNRADEIDRAVAWYNAGERDPQKRADIGATYRRLRAANQNRPAPELLLMTYNAFKDREASDYKRAQTGKLEAYGGDQLAGLLAPATASNPALEEERRAYDESVAKYGMDLVRSRFGPRP